MFGWLLAMMPHPSVSVPAVPFVLDSATITINVTGTSCGNPATYDISISYHGDAPGNTLRVETDNNGRGFTTYGTGYSVASFPLTVSAEFYFSGGQPTMTFSARVVDTGTGATSVTSNELTMDGIDCNV